MSNKQQLQTNNTQLSSLIEALTNKAAGGNNEQVAPEISIDSTTGLVTAVAGTKSSTYQLTAQAAQTYTPSTDNQTISAGVYLTGTQTIEGDANLKAENIKNGVTIFGVAGTLTEGSGESTTNNENALLEGTITTYTNNTLATLRNYAFYQVTSLQSVSMATCQRVGGAAFSGCTQLTTANFPQCISIASSGFYGCTKLKNISFPNCTSIFYRGFTNCASLTAIDFPKCTYVGGYAFQGCSRLATANLPLVKYIYSSTFQSCKSLATLSLPSISVIGSTAFGSCTKLVSIYLAGSQLCTLSNSDAFKGTGITSTAGAIYVPASMVDSYKAATNWTYFTNIIQAMEE